MNKQHKIFNLVEYYLDSSSHYLNLNKNSIQNYCLHLNDFSFYVANKNVDFKKIDYKFIQNYFYNYVKSNPSHYSFNCRKAAIKSFFQFLCIEEIIKTNPTDTLYRSAQSAYKKLPKVLSVETINNLLKADIKIASKKKRLRAKCIISLLYSTGMRVNELITLPVSEFKRNYNIKMRNQLESIYIKGKGDRERLAILCDETTNLITEYLKIRHQFVSKNKSQSSKYLFPSFSKKGCITGSYVNRVLKELADNINFPRDKISAHKIRHSFATHMLDNNVDLNTIRMLLGHSDIATTQIYLEVSEKRKLELVKNHHPLNIN